MSETFVGAAIPRKVDARLLRGDGRYVSDVTAPGMLAAAVVRSPFAHARINGIDTRAARDANGVHAVYTVSDLGAAQRPIATFGHFPPALVEQWQPRLRSAPVYPLATDRVRYVGEPVALVVAEDEYLAEDAAELVDVDYEPLPVVTNAEQALASDAATLHDGWDDNVALALDVEFGEVDEAFATARHVIEERFSSQRYTGVPLEGRGLLVVPGRTPPELTVWSSHQLPHFQRATISEALDIPELAVRVAQTDLGGGFGQKAGLYPEDVLIPFAAYRLGRPVKWVEDRQEHFLASSHSREQVFDAAAAVDDRGVLLGLRYRVLIDAGAYLTFPVVLPYLGVCHVLGPYKVPALRAEVRSVLTNKVTTAPYRGAGRPETVFVLNRLIDRIAGTVGLDPVEVRRRNMIQPEEMPYEAGILYRDGNPLVLDSGDYPAALDRCLEGIGYERFRASQEAERASGRCVGIGVACNVEATGIGPFEGARVVIDQSGHAFVYTGVVDAGQGLDTVFAQVCADGLGLEPNAVTVVTGDTATVGFSRGTYHSRAAVTAGNAVRTAAARARDKAIDVAAHLLEVAADDLELVDGSVRVKGSPERSVTLARCAQACIPGGQIPGGMDPGIDETAYEEFPSATWGHAVHAAIVAVDLASGEIEILRYLVVHDCGRMLNPLIVEGQIHGGVASGIGGALLEELVYDDEGQLVTTSFMDYLLPTATDIPALDVIHTETPTPLNALGVKGAGEGGAVAPPAALAAAVEDALAPFGARINATPMTPASIVAALRQARGVASK